MSISSKLCISCGLCCNGTFIGFVQVHQSELSTIRKVMKIEEADGKGFFLHPCSKLKSAGCSIYFQRPIECGKFKCQLLNAVENKKLDLNLAIEVTNAVKQKRATISKLLETLPLELQSDSFYFKMAELKNLSHKKKSSFSSSANYLELIRELKALDKLISKYFGISFQ